MSNERIFCWLASSAYSYNYWHSEDDSLLGYSTSIRAMAEAVCTPETSVYFNDSTRRYTPDDCHHHYHHHHHTRRRENLKYHILALYFKYSQLLVTHLQKVKMRLFAPPLTIKS
jgi:hypothetical protein